MAATHRRRTADRARLPRSLPQCRFVTNIVVSRRISVQGNVLSYAEFAPSPCPRSEDRPTLQPACLLFKQTCGAPPGRTNMLRCGKRFSTSPARQLRLRTQRVRSLSHVCSRLKKTRPHSRGGTAAEAWSMGNCCVRRPRTQQRLCTATARLKATLVHEVTWWLCAGGPMGPVVHLGAGKAAERLGFCRAQVGEGQVYSAPVTPSSVDGESASEVRVVAGFRRRAAAPDSRPSFFNSSGLHPSLVART